MGGQASHRYVDDFEVTLAPGSGFIFLGRETVELPAGPAERVDAAADEDGGRWSMYALWAGGYVHELWCRGDARPRIAGCRSPRRWTSPQRARAHRSTLWRLGPTRGVAMAFREKWHVRGSSTESGFALRHQRHRHLRAQRLRRAGRENGWSWVDDMHDEYATIADGRDNLSVEEAGYVDLQAGRSGFRRHRLR